MSGDFLDTLKSVRNRSMLSKLNELTSKVIAKFHDK